MIDLDVSGTNIRKIHIEKLQVCFCLLSSIETVKGRQRGRVVSAPDSQSGGPGFESRSGHLLDLCLVVPSLNSRPRL